MLRRGALLLVVLSFAACQFDNGDNDFTLRVPNPTPSSTKTRIVGLVGSLSGPDAWRGEDAFEGADLAVHVLNRSRAETEPMYELVTLDDQGDPARATQLVQQLAASDRTVGIVYAGPTQGLPATEQALAQGGVPAVLCYGDLYAARLLSPHVFQASPSFLWEARRIVNYLLVDRGYRRIGMLSAKDLTGETARRSLTLALQEEGRRLVASETFTPDLHNTSGLVEKLRPKRVQAVVIDAPPPMAVKIFRSLRLAGARYRSTAKARASASGQNTWAPQVAGFDLTITPSLAEVDLPPGTVAADSYARGVHYLPVPNFERFSSAFEDWWGTKPLGWERRGYDAVSMIGWAARKAAAQGRVAGTDLAPLLEKMDGVRFSGLEITFGPDDHMAVDQQTVGLWVIPLPGEAPEADDLPGPMPWVPLARGFSSQGGRTDVLPQDWRWLFSGAARPAGPAPPISRSRFGITSSARDPIH
jgi:branched-chain amino acid transport system substrate-binding protein